MTLSKIIGNCQIRLIKGDITDLEVEAFVYYARSDLKLGAGFGNAIAVRGGPTIQKELEQFGNINSCAAVITSAGDMKAEYIIHANGPKFQEPDLESKLEQTILNSLHLAEEKGIKQVAFPPMGTGFYAIPLQMCAEVMLRAFKEYLKKKHKLEEIIISVVDKREFEPFKKAIESLI
jgi:O-acetyl-ADP-ribose deacetylase (regulator of RNase III)